MYHARGRCHGDNLYGRVRIVCFQVLSEDNVIIDHARCLDELTGQAPQSPLFLSCEQEPTLSIALDHGLQLPRLPEQAVKHDPPTPFFLYGMANETECGRESRPGKPYFALSIYCALSSCHMIRTGTFMVECDIIIVRVGLSKGLDSAGLSLTIYCGRVKPLACL